MFVRVLAFATAVGSLGSIASAQARYQITTIETLPGSNQCLPLAINDAGLVTGYCFTTQGLSEEAFVWDGHATSSLGKLPFGHYSSGTAVNTAGVIAGDADAGNYEPRPFIIRGGQMLNVDPSGGANARVSFITDAGVVIGSYVKGGSSAWRAVQWIEEPSKPGRFRRITLPIVPGGDSKSDFGVATAGNNLAQVVGWVQSTLFGQRAAFWTNDSAHSVTTLDPLPGGSTSWAYGLNDLGEAVGDSYTPFKGSRAVLWRGDSAHTAVDLGVLDPAGESFARAINGAGQVIGLTRSADNIVGTFIWQNGTMSDLSTLLDESGAGWTLESVTAISDRGLIVGWGQFNGQRRGFVLTPML